MSETCTKCKSLKLELEKSLDLLRDFLKIAEEQLLKEDPYAFTQEEWEVPLLSESREILDFYGRLEEPEEQ